MILTLVIGKKLNLIHHFVRQLCQLCLSEYNHLFRYSPLTNSPQLIMGVGEGVVCSISCVISLQLEVRVGRLTFLTSFYI